LKVPKLFAAPGTKVTQLGKPGAAIEWRQNGPDLILRARHEGPMAGAFKIIPVPYQLVRD
jgi:hypothetical protein